MKILYYKITININISITIAIYTTITITLTLTIAVNITITIPKTIHFFGGNLLLGGITVLPFPVLGP